MVLDYLHIPISSNKLMQLLKIDTIGTPFRNLGSLQSLGLSILIEEGSLQSLKAYLELGLPLIVAVDTDQLSYWDEATDHAVVVAGIENEVIYLNDPNLSTAPQIVSLAEFELAWLEKDYLSAVIQLT
jgi:ABC-type bacteriocin/lantibiotic exporter with double-glycine peptidase domain